MEDWDRDVGRQGHGKGGPGQGHRRQGQQYGYWEQDRARSTETRSGTWEDLGQDRGLAPGGD